MLVWALVTTERNLNKLQRIQNTLARIAGQSPRSSSASSLQKSLRWLPVRQRFIYKTALITYKALTTGQPVYHFIYVTCFINQLVL